MLHLFSIFIRNRKKTLKALIRTICKINVKHSLWMLSKKPHSIREVNSKYVFPLLLPAQVVKLRQINSDSVFSQETFKCDVDCIHAWTKMNLLKTGIKENARNMSQKDVTRLEAQWPKIPTTAHWSVYSLQTQLENLSLFSLMWAVCSQWLHIAWHSNNNLPINIRRTVGK